MRGRSGGEKGQDSLELHHIAVLVESGDDGHVDKRLWFFGVED